MDDNQFKLGFTKRQGIHTWPDCAIYEGPFILVDKEGKGVEKS